MESFIYRLKAAVPDLRIPAPPAERVCSLSEADPRAFCGRLLSCLEAGTPVLLQDPAWPRRWVQEMEAACARAAHGPGDLLLATSGSTGVPKLCRHTLHTLYTAAEGYARRFGKDGTPHAVHVLPCHHIGGLMQLIRTAACSGRVHFADYRDSSSLLQAPFPLEEASLSLVPTQLYRLLEAPSGAEALSRFGLIFIGGAAAPRNLLERARARGLRLSLCYGSTETAAMVTALDPEAFLEGENSVGQPLPHARVSIDANRQIRVESASTTLGYLNRDQPFCRDPFITGDTGTFDDNGHLHILGRADRSFITGGEKVHPEQVESAALATGLVRSATCRGVADPDWGTRVELVVSFATSATDSLRELRLALAESLPAFALPKRILTEDET